MQRKRAILYLKISLTDDLDALMRQTEVWAKRRRLVLTEIITEANQRQPKLLRLLSRVRSRQETDFIVSASINHFSSLPKFLHTLARLQQTGIGVGFMRENVLLAGNAGATKTLYEVASSYVEAETFGRSQKIRQALYVSSLFGRRLGKPRLPETLRREVERQIRTGKSLREICRALDNRVSRTTVAKVRRELKKSDGV